jgi:hypothetical protein
MPASSPKAIQMTIIDTTRTTKAASDQPLNLAHLDVLHATSPIAEVALQERGTRHHCSSATSTSR